MRRRKPEIDAALSAAREAAIALGLPIHGEARSRYGLSSEALLAHELLNQMYSDLNSEPVNWDHFEEMLNELLRCDRFYLGHDVQVFYPLNVAMMCIVRKGLVEAEQRLRNGDESGGDRLYTSLRQLLSCEAFSDSLVSMLYGIGFWKQLLASLESVDPLARDNLSVEVFSNAVLPDLNDVLLGEFAFQWRQLDNIDHSPDPTTMRKQLKFLNNWILIYEELRDCPDHESLGNKYHSLKDRIKPNPWPRLFSSKRPLDSLDWISLDASVKQMQSGFENLRRSAA